KKPLWMREGGREMLVQLKPGDHVIITDLSRAFRNFREAVNQFEEWVSRGIHVHVTRLGMDTRTILGRFAIRLLAALAEMESETTAERTRIVMQDRKKRFGCASQNGMYGKKWLKKKNGERQLVDDPDERAVMAQIVRLHDQERFSFREIYWHFITLN